MMSGINTQPSFANKLGKFGMGAARPAQFGGSAYGNQLKKRQQPTSIQKTPSAPPMGGGMGEGIIGGGVNIPPPPMNPRIRTMMGGMDGMGGGMMGGMGNMQEPDIYNPGFSYGMGQSPNIQAPRNFGGGMNPGGGGIWDRYNQLFGMNRGMY